MSPNKYDADIVCQNILLLQDAMRLYEENAKLRELVNDYYDAQCLTCNPWADSGYACKHCESGNCLLAVRTLEMWIGGEK